MSTTIVIEPTQSLIDTIVSLIKRDTTDWSDVAIVFPGKRPAHFVRKALGELCRKSFVPPKFFSIDEFIDFLHHTINPTQKKNLEAVDAVALLFQVHLGIKERLGESNFNSLDAFFPVGQKLFGELEEVRIANLQVREINETLKPISFGRLNALPQYYEDFYTLTAKKGYSTRSMRYSEVAAIVDNLDLSKFSSVLVAGFMALTKSEQQIFAGLQRRNNTTFIYQQGHGLREHFQRLKIEEEIAEPKESRRAEISLYEAQDTHGQVFALSTLLEKKIKDGERVNEKTAIVLPTADALFPLYHQTLPLLKQEEYNIALGYPLSRTPIYGFVNSLMDLVSARQGDRFPASSYLKFVLHPYTKNIRFNNRSDVTRILFHKIEETIAGETSKMFVTLDELESMDEVFTGIPHLLEDDSISSEQVKSHLRLIHDQTIRKFGSFRSIGDLANKAIEVLMFVYDRSTASLHPLFRDYAETIVESFREIELSLLSNYRFDTTEGYFNFLKRFVAMKEVPFSGTPLRGLQVLGLLETRNLQFDDVYVLDANDDVIPGGVSQEMMLPQGLREKLGLETYKSRERLVEYYFGLLLSGAKRVHCFFSETGKSEKSRFIEKILWERQKREGLDSARRLTSVIRYGLKLSNAVPEPIDKSPEVVSFLKNSSFSASALDMYLRCPLKFYYSKVLKLEEKEEAGEEVDQQEVGKFVHAVLKRLFEPFVGRKLSPPDLDPVKLERIVDELFTEHFGTENVGTLYLLKRQVVRQLKSVLANYQVPRLAKSEIVIDGLEQIYNLSPFTFHVSPSSDLSPFTFNLDGRLDRIEHRAGEIYILDYKTGKDDAFLRINFTKLNVEVRETWPQAIGSLQLPFYLLLYSTKNNAEIKHIHPAYVFLGRNTLDETIEVEFEEDGEKREANFRIIERVIESLLREIVSENTPFVPTEDLQKNCPDCQFKTICGTQWVG